MDNEETAMKASEMAYKAFAWLVGVIIAESIVVAIERKLEK